MKKNLTAIFIFFIIPFSSMAWGSKGHKIIALFAKNCLEKPVIDSVKKYLGNVTFEDAAVWMDEIKSDKKYDYMKPWHYLNIEKDKTYVKTKNPEIINELEIYINELKDKGQKDFSTIHAALKIIFHLVGDIHQPLHCGYGEDKGGNSIKLFFLNKETNLHAIWDSEIINEANITLNECFIAANEMSNQEKNKIQTLNIETWMYESRNLLTTVYDFNDKINQDYIDKNKIIVKKQLVKAGIRLATVLNYVFRK